MGRCCLTGGRQRHTDICMKTTLDIEDALLRSAKARAAETGRTLTGMIEAGLRDLLRAETKPRARFRMAWPVADGGPAPGVDVADRDALYERMESRGR